jgi:hypothetical protein
VERLQAETRSLEALREEIHRELEHPTSQIWPVGSLSEIWARGAHDAGLRRDLLTEFFEELTVRGSEIIAAVPRSDRAAEVAALLEGAYRGFTSGDPGGVRTRDLSLERAAS